MTVIATLILLALCWVAITSLPVVKGQTRTGEVVAVFGAWALVCVMCLLAAVVTVRGWP